MWKITLGLTSAVCLLAQVSAPGKQWTLVFTDEFEGSALNLTRWSPHDPFGDKRSGELARAVPEAITVSAGQAMISARHEGGEPPFTSGVMTTRGTFAQMYGRFEVRLRIAEGRGLETRVQLLPVSLKTLPAIDILDALGAEPGSARFENRWGDEKTERAFGDTWAGPSLAEGFHTVAVEWDAGSIVWLVDGRKRFESTEGVPREPMYMALSLAVGGRRAKVPGPEVHFPAVFILDYIRVYRKS